MRIARTSSIALLAIIAAFSPVTSWAKGKGGGQTPGESIVWLTTDQVENLLSPGTFWCGEPRDNSCTFSATASGVQNGALSNEVVGLWEENTLIREHRNAVLTDEGYICEDNAVNIKRVNFTNIDGSDISVERNREFKIELHNDFSNPETAQTCFAYALEHSENANLVTQYEVEANGEKVRPIIFLIDRDREAESQYVYRWE